ncbi:MAG: hypothetical protein KIT87_27585 [Anaerolineae bacterium]|nr:hypothetical protein [Anaerolineae bacterium]
MRNTLRGVGLVWLLALLVAACQGEGSGGGPTAPTALAQPTSAVPASGSRPQGGPPQPRETATPAASSGPSPLPAGAGVVFAAANGLWVVEEGKPPRQLTAETDISHPLIAPTKAWVVYRREASGQAELWAISWAGGSPKRVLSARELPPSPTGLQSVTWGRTVFLPRSNKLLFNTVFIGSGGSSTPNDDLWSLNIETGQIKTLLPAGQAGFFVPDFDAGKIAVSRPSRGQTPGAVFVVNAEGGDPKTYLEFPPAPRRQPYPAAHWARDGSGFLLAVEQGDGLDLYRVPLDGTGEKFGRIEGQPINLTWSPDRRRLAYSRLAVPSAPTPAPAENYAVVIADASDENAQPYARGLFVNWSPDSARFVYQDGPAVYLGTYSQPTRLLGTAAGSLWDVRWMTTRALVYLTGASGRPGESPELVYRTVAGDPLLLLPKTPQPRGLWFDIIPNPYPEG